jgi:hypothetical protein
MDIAKCRNSPGTKWVYDGDSVKPSSLMGRFGLY